MFPYLLELGPLKIGSYGLMMAIGFLWGWRFMRKAAIWRGWDPELAYTIVISSMISGIVGARLFHVIDHWDHFQNDLGRIFTANSGLTWYGGLILAIIVNYYWCVKYRVKFTACLDLVAAGLASGYAWGRVGCIFAGDGCYGIPVEPPWEWIGMTFPRGLVPTVTPVHPTPVYEALFNFALWGLLIWLDYYRNITRRWGYGTLIGIFAVLHSAERFAIEFIRLNDRYWFGEGGLVKISSDAYYAGQFGLSFSQWISIGGILVGLAVFVWALTRKTPPFAIDCEGADRYKQGWRADRLPESSQPATKPKKSRKRK